MRRRDLADLQVGARRHIGIAAAEGIGRIGQPAHLPGVQDAVGNAQPAHEGVLRRRDVEQPVILGEEDVDALGELARLGAAHHLVPAIERMTCALGGFLGDQLAARRDRRGPGRRAAGHRARWLDRPAGAPAVREASLSAALRASIPLTKPCSHCF